MESPKGMIRMAAQKPGVGAAKSTRRINDSTPARIPAAPRRLNVLSFFLQLAITKNLRKKD
jgi:hypothetical protein